MTKSTFSQRLEKFFWIYLFVNPFLDILNGMFLKIVKDIGVLDVETASLSITPSLALRMIVLLFFVAYLLIQKDKKSIFTLIPIAIAWVLSVVSEYVLTNKVVVFTDLQYITRFCYNLIILFVYTRVLYSRWRNHEQMMQELDKLISFTLIILSLSIILCVLTGTGYPTYADRKGYRGNRGFFYAGNDVTAILLLLTPISMAKFMSMQRNKASGKELLLYLLPAPLAANTLMIIGTKTAFLAIAACYLFLFLYALLTLILRKEKHLIIGYGIQLATFAGVFLVLNLFTKMGVYNGILESLGVNAELIVEEGVDAALTSGRTLKVQRHWKALQNGSILNWLFGMGRGSQQEIVEMDLHEVFFYYGIFGIMTMLWAYGKAGFQFITCFLKKIDVISFALFIALGLCIGYLVFAGHILFSVTSGLYFVFVILYSRAYFAKKPSDILFFK